MNTPLVIVDGSRTDYNQLSLYEIESISVLKDAAAVALYGQQAANGVLLVTTKRGFVGKTTIDVNVNIGWQEFANKPDMLNAYEYAVLHNQARTNDGLPVTQFNMTEIEELGLLKMDFLGLRTLTVIRDAEAAIQKKDPSFSIRKLDYDDAATYKDAGSG